jgi:chemotaxis signal transduction protein
VTPHLVLLRVGAERFALPLEGVWHILPTQRVFPLALIRPEFRGVFLYQGEVVPLLDLPALVGGGAGSGFAYTVIYGTELGLLGLPVDQVLQIVECRSGTVAAREPAPPAPVLAQSHFVYGGNEYPLLDVETLLNTLSR